jgi:hypothetical protein
LTRLDETDEIDEIGVPLMACRSLADGPSPPLSLSLPTGKLKFPDRMRLVSKNKDEGTELFKGAVDVAQFRAAAARYNKALTHASKFVDLSPDQREEVNAMKLSLHLNVAACWLKITDADNHLDQVRWGHHRRDKGGQGRGKGRASGDCITDCDPLG